MVDSKMVDCFLNSEIHFPFIGLPLVPRSLLLWNRERWAESPAVPWRPMRSFLATRQEMLVRARWPATGENPDSLKYRSQSGSEGYAPADSGPWKALPG